MARKRRHGRMGHNRVGSLQGSMHIAIVLTKAEAGASYLPSPETAKQAQCSLRRVVSIHSKD
jgi:hypothetical protein